MVVGHSMRESSPSVACMRTDAIVHQNCPCNACNKEKSHTFLKQLFILTYFYAFILSVYYFPHKGNWKSLIQSASFPDSHELAIC